MDIRMFTSVAFYFTFALLAAAMTTTEVCLNPLKIIFVYSYLAKRRTEICPGPGCGLLPIGGSVASRWGQARLEPNCHRVRQSLAKNAAFLLLSVWKGRLTSLCLWPINFIGSINSTVLLPSFWPALPLLEDLLRGCFERQQAFLHQPSLREYDRYRGAPQSHIQRGEGRQLHWGKKTLP